MPSIFLSYCSTDRAIARRLVKALEAGGCKVWWDGLIEGGERFAATIETALDEADVVVVLWSRASLGSHWVKDEAARGRDRERLVPVAIEAVQPPLGFGQIHTIDLSNWKGKAGAPEVADLLRAIDIAAGQPETERPAPVPVSRGPSRRALFVGSGATVLLAGGGFAAWKGGLFAPAGLKNSVAVLPFRNLSGDPGQDYFAEGIAEEIRNTLARNPLLKVIATTSSNMFRTRSEALTQVAAKLDVEHLLDGSVRRDGDKVRIAVQLIDGGSGATRWTETYERAFGEILKAQAEIATAVLQMLNIQMSGAGIAGDLRQTGGTNDPAAFDAFIRGRAEFERFNPQGFRAGLQHYRQASALDPKYAAAFSGEARCLINLASGYGGDGGGVEAMTGAVALARKAHAIAPESAFVNIVLAGTLADSLQVREAWRYCETASRIALRHLDVPTIYGLISAYRGDLAVADPAIERAISVDRLNPRVWLGKAWIRYWSGEYEATLRVVDQIWSENPAFATAADRGYFEVLCNLALDRPDVARAAAQTLPASLERDWQLALVALHDKDEAPAIAWLAKTADRAATGGALAYDGIGLLVRMGRTADALNALETEFGRRNTQLVRIRIDPLLKPLAGEPAFKALQRRIGLVD